MPSALPIADPAPLDGLLPSSVADGVEARDFGVYLHVPFCRVRCGYCDFNTYTSDELRGAKRSDFASQAIAEVALADAVLTPGGPAASRGGDRVLRRRHPDPAARARPRAHARARCATRSALRRAPR